MYIPDVSGSLDPRSTVVPPTLPLDKSKFDLDASGVVGVFGGDEAILAIAAVHVYGNRRWLGWYNSPGSYQLAKKFGRVATSGFFNGFFPGASTEPATLFNLDGRQGPRFRGVYSGTVIEGTGHLATLLVDNCASLHGQSIRGRRTQPIEVTVADLNYIPPSELNIKYLSDYSPIFASIPIFSGVTIFASVATCAVCGIFQDWYAFVTILSGILASGITCSVIGGGKFTFIHPQPAEGSPAGDGILTSDKGIVLLKGAEGAVNCITRGRFSLHFSSKPNYQDIGWCSILFTIQFVAQLLLTPHASLFGQIMFVVSLVVSWIYNSWLSSLNKKIQREILLDNVLGKPNLNKYILGTRTTMVVFILLVLKTSEPRRILDELLPNDTNVWRRWKYTIVERFVHREMLVFEDGDWELEGFTETEMSLLRYLYRDAQTAWDFYAQLQSGAGM